MAELLPCPWCGALPKNYGGDQWGCNNPDCPESGAFPLEKWNRRRAAPEVVEALETILADTEETDELTDWAINCACGQRGWEAIAGTAVESYRAGLRQRLAALRVAEGGSDDRKL